MRGDDVKQANLIHLDILRSILDAPMALCDLSSHNPNVLFELGLRQAFDKPVVLVQEAGSKPIFDIGPLRYTEYRRARTYHEVLEDQQNIARALAETKEAVNDPNNVNSIVRLLGITRPAQEKDVQAAEKDPIVQILLAEMSKLRAEMRSNIRAMNQAFDDRHSGPNWIRFKQLSESDRDGLIEAIRRDMLNGASDKVIIEYLKKEGLSTSDAFELIDVQRKYLKAMNLVKDVIEPKLKPEF